MEVIIGKRSDFGEKRPRDLWPTLDPDAVKPLAPYIEGMTFAEPCCGAFDLIGLLQDHTGASCTWASDLEPQVKFGAHKRDALTLTSEDVKDADVIITNPPFSWKLLEPLLQHLPTLKPTWLLLPGNVMFNKRMGPYMETCSTVVSVGRLYWLPNKIKGVDDYAWYGWDEKPTRCVTRFVGRTEPRDI